MAGKKLMTRYKDELKKSSEDILIETLEHRVEDFRDNTDETIDKLKREKEVEFPKLIKRAKAKVSQAKEDLKKVKTFGPMSHKNFDSYISAVISAEKEVSVVESALNVLEGQLSSTEAQLAFYEDIKESISD